MGNTCDTWHHVISGKSHSGWIRGSGVILSTNRNLTCGMDRTTLLINLDPNQFGEREKGKGGQQREREREIFLEREALSSL